MGVVGSGGENLIGVGLKEWSEVVVTWLCSLYDQALSSSTFVICVLFCMCVIS